MATFSVRIHNSDDDVDGDNPPLKYVHEEWRRLITSVLLLPSPSSNTALLHRDLIRIILGYAESALLLICGGRGEDGSPADWDRISSGEELDSDRSVPLLTCEIYNVDTNQWYRAPPNLPSELRGSGIRRNEGIPRQWTAFVTVDGRVMFLDTTARFWYWDTTRNDGAANSAAASTATPIAAAVTSGGNSKQRNKTEKQKSDRKKSSAALAPANPFGWQSVNANIQWTAVQCAVYLAHNNHAILFSPDSDTIEVDLTPHSLPIVVHHWKSRLTCAKRAVLYRPNNPNKNANKADDDSYQIYLSNPPRVAEWDRESGIEFNETESVVSGFANDKHDENAAVVIYQNKLLLIGGGGGRGWGDSTDQVSALDLLTYKWVEFPSLLQKRSCASVIVTTDQRLYVIGGHAGRIAEGHNSDGGGRPRYTENVRFSSVEMYDDREQRWIRMTQMLNKRSDCMVFQMPPVV